MGSPPLVRERLYIAEIGTGHPGITPARAGKTECVVKKKWES